MFLGTDVPRTYMLPGANFYPVEAYLCSPVFVGIHCLQPSPRYDSRLGLCLGFIFRVLVRVRVRIILELRSVLRLWL